MRRGRFSLLEEIIVDNFAGGGGASTGIELATGRIVDIAINHDPDAILMHRTNHPHTQHIQASVWDVDPVEVCRGRSVGLAWFSPDCKHFSKAKGGKPVDKAIRGLAWIVLRWAGEVRPRVIILENVEEFQTWGPVRRGRPVKAKSGQTFRRFVAQLRGLGYDLDWRELVAADYGAPTTRKRFFLVARCDGRPIVWPEPTHAPADSPEVRAGRLKPWRSAAEIIDWSQPMYSVFESREEIRERYGATVIRPLADNTIRRIIRGVDKFTLRSGQPYLVPVGYGERQGQAPTVGDISNPLGTVVSRGIHAVCDPLLAPVTVSNTSGSVGAPATWPVHTITTDGGQILHAAYLTQYHTERSEMVRGQGLQTPICTVDTANRYALCSCNLVQYFSEGHAHGVDVPLHTVTTHDREALVAAHVCKFKGTNLGQSPDTPLQTITAQSRTFAACAAVCAKAAPGADLGYWPQIRALLNRHCGYHLAEDEILLLTIAGAVYYIRDILMRMLTPRELYNAMGFPADYLIARDYTGCEYPRSKQVARCGNAVPPPLAAAMIRANLPEWCGEEISTMEQLGRIVAS